MFRFVEATEFWTVPRKTRGHNCPHNRCNDKQVKQTQEGRKQKGEFLFKVYLLIFLHLTVCLKSFLTN